jgi:hypothetical protein
MNYEYFKFDSGSDIVCTRKLGGIIHSYSRRAA